jgi:hypothetical protein
MGLLCLLGLLIVGPSPATASMAQFQSRVGSLIDTAHGVAILPRTLMISSDESAFVPIVLSFLPPDIDRRMGEYTREGYAFYKGVNCTEQRLCALPPPLRREIQDFRTRIIENYEGLVDAPYYAKLMANVCSQTPGLCDVDATERTDTRHFENAQDRRFQRSAS